MADSSVAVESLPHRRPARRRPRPIALYLFLLALVALVPAFVFSAILLQRNNEAQERVVETLITGSARSIVQAVEREINANITTLRVLATTPSLLEGDLEAFHAQVSTALAGSGSYIYLLDDKLNSIMSTRQPYTPQPGGPSSDPISGRRALESRDVVVSNLVMGQISRQWGINMLLPVFRGGRPSLLMGFSRNAAQLSAALLVNKMPAGWNVALVDANGAIIAASPGGGTTGAPFPFGDVKDLSSGAGWNSVRGNGSESLVVAQHSYLTGWSVVAWAPREVVAKPLSEAFWTLLLGGILLAALVIAVIYWVILQIGRSVHGLEADAKRLGAGQPVEPRPFPVAEIETVSKALAEASRRRQAAEIEVRFLMRELAHRSKNQMTVIAAMAKQTARGADSVPEFVSSFERRIFGLARSTDLLLANGVAGVDLKELVASQVDPFCPVDDHRVSIEGPAFRLNNQSAQILGMAAHELATNAAKYGAFVGETGTLSVRWALADASLTFTWRESGAAPVPENARRGFGTTVIESMVGRSLGAEVKRTAHADGVEWRFSIPLSALDASAEAATAAEAEK